MVKKYQVNVQIELSVEADNKRIARRSVRYIPWEDVIKFQHPKTGLVREFRITADENAAKILDVKED